MRLLSRRREPAESVAVVPSWGLDAIGTEKMDTILARNGVLLAGHTSPSPAGWGIAGSQETTDQSIWATPQGFTAAAGPTALTIWGPGGARPIKYPTDAHAASIVLPGPGGV